MSVNNLFNTLLPQVVTGLTSTPITQEDTPATAGAPNLNPSIPGNSVENPFVVGNSVPFNAGNAPNFIKLTDGPLANVPLVKLRSRDNEVFYVVAVDLRTLPAETAAFVQANDFLVSLKFTGQSVQVQTGTQNTQQLVGYNTSTQTVNFEDLDLKTFGAVDRYFTKDLSIAQLDQFLESSGEFRANSLNDISNLAPNLSVQDALSDNQWESANVSGDPTVTNNTTGTSADTQPGVGFIQMSGTGVAGAPGGVFAVAEVNNINDQGSKAFTAYQYTVFDQQGQKFGITLRNGQVSVTRPNGSVQVLGPNDSLDIPGVARFFFDNRPGGLNGSPERRLVVQSFEKASPELKATLIAQGARPQDVDNLILTKENTHGFRIPDGGNTYRASDGVFTGSPVFPSYYDSNFDNRKVSITLYKQVPIYQDCPQPTYENWNGVCIDIIPRKDCDTCNTNYLPPSSDPFDEDGDGLIEVGEDGEDPEDSGAPIPAGGIFGQGSTVPLPTTLPAQPAQPSTPSSGLPVTGNAQYPAGAYFDTDGDGVISQADINVIENYLAEQGFEVGDPLNEILESLEELYDDLGIPPGATGTNFAQAAPAASTQQATTQSQPQQQPQVQAQFQAAPTPAPVPPPQFQFISPNTTLNNTPPVLPQQPIRQPFIRSNPTIEQANNLASGISFKQPQVFAQPVEQTQQIPITRPASAQTPGSIRQAASGTSGFQRLFYQLFGLFGLFSGRRRR